MSKYIFDVIKAVVVQCQPGKFVEKSNAMFNKHNEKNK